MRRPRTDRRPVTTPFAHASEAEMSRILDFYAVRWEYEPHTFPILWNLNGEVVESFAPDFYLPDLDLYLEMTTLRQKLVRKKNRKLRRLRELYPDLNVKLFYARDFRALMLKYGRLALVDGLSGTLGQVAAPHSVASTAEPGQPVDESAANAESSAAPTTGSIAGPGLTGAASGRSTRSGRRRVIDHDAPINEGAIQA
jgi:hypoxanthine phosphoribosyltransferase